MTALAMALGLALDWVLGEPRRAHPLVAFGRLVHTVERGVYAPHRLNGVLGVALLVVPITALALGLAYVLPLWGRVVLDVALLYFALGHRSLHDHARPIERALQDQNLPLARELAARIVSRDQETLDPASATVESVLENGNDGVFGALFWFCIAGGAGALAYRLINTLDAMWGYRNARYENFGWAAAKLDDLANWPAARLTALSYALLGHTRSALHCWRTQAPLWDSPNAGPVMAAGAGALHLRLGGAARYDGVWHERPALGEGAQARGGDITRALRLVRHGVGLWLALVCCFALFAAGLRHA